MERRKLILDMDGDADNLLALAYALRSPEVEVLGVVTGHGFYQPETAAEGVRKLLEAMGHELPVVPGARRPLIQDNLAEALERPASGAAMDTAAWDWMYKALMESEGKVTIGLLGTATNLAHLLKKHPEAAGKIEKILFAGGAFLFGTVTASACHKVYFDAEAMQLLLHAGIPFYMASVDVTSGYTEGVEVRELLSRWSGSLWRAVEAELRPAPAASRWLRTPLALAALTHPELFRYDKCKCEVELHGRITYGMTVVYRNHFAGVRELEDGTKVREEVAEKDKNIWYMDQFDRQRVMELLTERIGGLEGKGGAA